MLVPASGEPFFFVKGVQRLLTTRPRGTNDILPEEIGKWHTLEKTLRLVAGRYGFKEIRTPIIEHTELFQRGVGESTDIVEKEMYTFIDRGKRSVTLRPEATASTVRAFVENKLYTGPQPTKLYYLGPMFRYDRPQAGRYGSFTSSRRGFRDGRPALMRGDRVGMKSITARLEDLTVELNSVGCPVAGRLTATIYFGDPAALSFASVCQERLIIEPHAGA